MILQIVVIVNHLLLIKLWNSYGKKNNNILTMHKFYQEKLMEKDLGNKIKKYKTKRFKTQIQIQIQI